MTRGLPLTRLVVVGTAVLLTLGGAPATAAPSTDVAASPDPVQLPIGFRPEGVTSGPDDTYYAGSVANGRIWTGDLSEGSGHELLAPSEGRSLRGLWFDPRSRLLWAVGQDGEIGIVLVVDSTSGDVLHRIVVPGAVFLNDLVITRSTVWVTDSQVDRLTRIALDQHGHPAGDPTFLPLTGAWPTPEGFRANGIRALPGGLVLDNSTAGGLWLADPVTGVVTAIPVMGGPGITGGDGLELVGRTLYVVRGSGQQEVSVLGLHRDAGGWTAQWLGRLTSPDLDVPSTATFAQGRLWAVNARFGVADPDTASFAIVPLPRDPA